MAEFLDFLNTPAGQGLLSGVAAYAAGARRGQPVNSLGRGLLGGVAGYQYAQNQAQEADQHKFQNDYRRMQMDKMQTEMDAYKKQQEWKAGFPAMLQQSQPRVEQFQADNPFGEDLGNMATVSHGNPQALQEYMMRPESPYADKLIEQQLFPKPAKIGFTPSGVAYDENNPSSLKIGENYAKPDSLPSAIQEYKFAVSQGYNGSFDKWNKETRQAGANNFVLPKIEVKTGESIATQVGPMLKESREKAISGINLVNSANRILSVAEKGNLYVGPGANLLMKGAQVADVFGFGGKDTKEKIANTRAVIRGMAEQAVQARSQLGGQSQISNAEQELLNKATSGDISDLTAGEVIQIAELNDTLGRQLYQVHQDQLSNMANDQNLTGLAKFYGVPQIAPARKKKATQNNGWSVKEVK